MQTWCAGSACVTHGSSHQRSRERGMSPRLRETFTWTFFRKYVRQVPDCSRVSERDRSWRWEMLPRASIRSRDKVSSRRCAQVYTHRMPQPTGCVTARTRAYDSIGSGTVRYSVSTCPHYIRIIVWNGRGRIVRSGCAGIGRIGCERLIDRARGQRAIRALDDGGHTFLGLGELGLAAPAQRGTMLIGVDHVLELPNIMV